MTKIGRNNPCHCGSGKKFKHCHALLNDTSKTTKPYPSIDELQAIHKMHEVLEIQRVRQQGHGKPIISAEMQGTRFVAIGNQIAYGPWKTFQDFLLHHVKVRFGKSWYESEIAKSEENQHHFMHWLRAMGNRMQQHSKNPGEINSMPMCGATSGIVGLAYDLYTIEHHSQNEKSRKSLERLMHRLRHPDQFFGARHEARVAGILLRAGFELQWEDEGLRQAGGHGEFIATFPETRRTFWVECKMRQAEDTNTSFRYTHLVSEALRKTTDLERLIFVELAYTNGKIDADNGGWPGAAINQLRILESQPSAAELPSAIVIISNFPEHSQMNQALVGAGMIMEGFKTDCYRTGRKINLIDAISLKKSNLEIEFLWRSIEQHSQIPTTFDGSIHGLDDNKRLIIGKTYELPDGQTGTLEEAIVMPQWEKAVGIMRLPNGTKILATFDLSPEELEAWENHPDTFFGELRPHNPPAKDSTDLYDFFIKRYTKTPREKLLEFMKSHSNFEELCALSQHELVANYAYYLTASIAQRDGPPTAPLWQQRLRPVKP